MHAYKIINHPASRKFEPIIKACAKIIQLEQNGPATGGELYVTRRPRNADLGQLI